LARGGRLGYAVNSPHRLSHDRCPRKYAVSTALGSANSTRWSRVSSIRLTRAPTPPNSPVASRENPDHPSTVRTSVNSNPDRSPVTSASMTSEKTTESPGLCRHDVVLDEVDVTAPAAASTRSCWGFVSQTVSTTSSVTTKGLMACLSSSLVYADVDMVLVRPEEVLQSCLGPKRPQKGLRFAGGGRLIQPKGTEVLLNLAKCTGSILDSPNQLVSLGVVLEFTRFRGRLAIWVSSRMGVKPFEGNG